MLDAHALDCCHVQRTRFLKDPWCRFTNIQKQLLARFVVYADFESTLQRVGDEAMNTTQVVAVGGDEPTPAGPFQELLSYSFACKLVSSVVPDFFRPLVSCRVENAGEIFVRKRQEEAEQLFQEYTATPQQLLALTEAELHSFHTAINWHICNQAMGGNKVRDHCHIVGNYRIAHSRCNLAYRLSKSDWKLPVVIHNLKGYGGHLIAKAPKNEFGVARVIPQNMDLSITVDRLKFIDSL